MKRLITRRIMILTTEMTILNIIIQKLRPIITGFAPNILWGIRIKVRLHLLIAINAMTPLA